MPDLEGYLVVSLEQAVAAPYASMKLADAGARVIKVERPEGDFARGYDDLVRGSSAYFVWLNRGKQSLRLDLRREDDCALLESIAARADIFIQNLGPGRAARFGFGAAALRQRHPALIVCSISGYGESGPMRDQKAYDLLVQAETGLCAINGSAETPSRVAISLCDIAAGAAAYQAILEAVIGRLRTSAGRAIEVSLFHALSDWMNVPYLQQRYGGKAPRRVGLRHPSIAPYAGYACGDGKMLLISIQNEREWWRLCEAVLERPDLVADTRFADNSLRVAHRDELDAIIGSVFGEATREAVIGRLEAAGIAFGRLSEIEDLATHPQNVFVKVATEAGVVEILAPGPRVPETLARLPAVPRLGEHDDAIRAEFGAPAAGG